MSQDTGSAGAILGGHPSPVGECETDPSDVDSRRMSQAVPGAQLPAGDDEAACANCGVALTGPFCAECGQRHRPFRLSIRGVANDVISRLTSVDRGFVHTAVQLTVAPGVVVRDFVDGRTVVYAHPFGYLVFAFATFAILSGLMGGTSGTGGAENRLFIALIVPFMAFAARMYFWRGDMNYAEHLIAAGYMIAHIALFFGIMQIAIPVVTALPGDLVPHVFLFVVLGVGIAYLAWAYSRIFESRPLQGAAGGLLSLVGGIALWAVFMMALLRLIRG
jgi:hypothetical protein